MSSSHFIIWHRRMGLMAAFFLLILAVSGLILNHTDELGLDDRTLDTGWLLNWYGLTLTGTPLNYSSGDVWVTRWEAELFFNGMPLLETTEALKGIVVINDVVVIALDNTVMLLNVPEKKQPDLILPEPDKAQISMLTNEIIERISLAEFTIKKIGLDLKTNSDVIIFETTEGDVYKSEDLMVSWQKSRVDNVNWSEPASLSRKQEKKIQKRWSGSSLNLERVLLDLHSGRLFHPVIGVLIMDLSALIMIWLGFSGIRVWFSRRRRRPLYKKPFDSQ